MPHFIQYPPKLNFSYIRQKSHKFIFEFFLMRKSLPNFFLLATCIVYIALCQEICTIKRVNFLTCCFDFLDACICEYCLDLFKMLYMVSLVKNVKQNRMENMFTKFQKSLQTIVSIIIFQNYEFLEYKTLEICR